MLALVVAGITSISHVSAMIRVELDKNYIFAVTGRGACIKKEKEVARVCGLPQNRYLTSSNLSTQEYYELFAAIEKTEKMARVRSLAQVVSNHIYLPVYAEWEQKKNGSLKLVSWMRQGL